jgi:hypothetical protein
MGTTSRENAGSQRFRFHGSCDPDEAGRRCSFLRYGVPHPGCFAQRVRKVLRRLKIGFLPMQKSV